ncbi:MAG: flagellar basal-body MS-ring/collar protein FliF [Candidatus Treponema excrementipullorum]|nr:flagellar M-ring protein FliF [Spirochaetia bacterium]MCI7589640.1 flagellar M-ring protein FliF [Spirochaetia bacterium]MDD7013199.1 flagellar basal-body MS-ring/collar protein FliF [Candidatus Treponema excrementipullorum]MDY2756632.1 flagellar basal-body MS-ring/collar protein FliF [Candidatus Treponema excrementipullorum]MDY4708704.1 flagellar basal-body MS-ring/collar protein FliF [Candidatus Treponema excrementipullorum]
MNEWLKKVVASLKGLWSKWSLVQKIILFAVIVAVVVAFIVMMTFSAQPSDVPLFSVPITDEAARDKIIYRLDEENVSSNVNAAGLITVKDEATARRMRSILVREDLVPSNVDPWNLFDVERWTTTDFERNVNLRRSITEMVRQHIEALDDVDRANVVINVPEKTLLAADQDPTTASVVITPKPGSDITTNKKKIEGIQKLLITSVPGLTAENISISDPSGVIINDFEGMESSERVDIIAKEQKLIKEQEMYYRARILAALQNTFSADRVRDLNVKIDMDMSKRQVSGTEYSPIVIKPDDPNTPYDDSEVRDYLPISTETVTKKWTGTGFNPEGPAGVEGQNPPVYSDMSNLIGTSEESGVKQNNVLNTAEYLEEKSPSIDRITVSVNIDGTWEKEYDEKGNLIINPNGSIARKYIPVDPAVLASTTSLIQSAIGYDRIRGDTVSVQNIQYDRSAQFAEEDEKFRKAQQQRTTILVSIAGIAAILLAFVVIRLITRSIERRRRLKQEEMLRQSQLEREKTIWEAEQAGMEVTMSVEERRRAELQENAVTMAKEHPEDVAMLIRTWLMEE